MPSPRNKLTTKEVTELSEARDMLADARAANDRLSAEMATLLEKIDVDGAYRKLEAQRSVAYAQGAVADKKIHHTLDKVSKRIRAVGKKLEVNLSTFAITVKE